MTHKDFLPSSQPSNLPSWFLSGWMVEVVKYSFPHLWQTEFKARLAELGEKFVDVDSDVKALEAADQGELFVTFFFFKEHQPFISVT